MKNALIEKMADEGFSSPDVAPFYKFDKNILIFNELWLEYFGRHLKVLEGFNFWHLSQFLQRRNPNVPNIGGKLFEPTLRKMTQPRNFWKIVLNEREVPCIYSGELVNPEKFSLDHFVPWSFTAHDLVWNLIPTFENTNSSKGNNLPDMDTYFHDFSSWQYDAFQIVHRQKPNHKLLEDYALLFKNDIPAISKLGKSEFQEKMRQQISPLMQIAANMGFAENWKLP